jgi:hypothetical protein
VRELTESTASLFVILSEFFLFRPHHPLSLLVCFPYRPAFVAAFVLSTPDYLYHIFPSFFLFSPHHSAQISHMAGITDSTAEALAAQQETSQMMTEMAETLAYLKARMDTMLTTALEQIIGRPANPLTFPQGANGMHPAISTSFLHPHLLPNVILQIREFKYPPASLGRLLEMHLVTLPAPLLFVMGPNGRPSSCCGRQ